MRKVLQVFEACDVAFGEVESFYCQSCQRCVIRKKIKERGYENEKSGCKRVEGGLSVRKLNVVRIM